MSAATTPEPDRLVYTPEELLSSGSYEAPLVANGVRCHGGFEADGRYRSPRTLHRNPAIGAWKAALAREGHDLIELDAALMPPQYPSVEQATLLLEHGVRDPIARALTIISIVEGFGAIIRDVQGPRPGEPGGRARRWHGARAPRPGPLRSARPRRVGLSRRGRPQADVGGRPRPRSRESEDPRRRADAHDGAEPAAQEGQAPLPAARRDPRAPAPDDGPGDGGGGLRRGDLRLGGARALEPRGLGRARRRRATWCATCAATRIPHVEYLRTALSEVAARTLRTVDGGTIAGREVVHGLLHRILRNLTTTRRGDQREDLRANLTEAMQVAANPKALLEEFDSLELGMDRRPRATGFEPAPGVKRLERLYRSILVFWLAGRLWLLYKPEDLARKWLRLGEISPETPLGKARAGGRLDPGLRPAHARGDHQAVPGRRHAVRHVPAGVRGPPQAVPRRHSSQALGRDPGHGRARARKAPRRRLRALRPRAHRRGLAGPGARRAGSGTAARWR